MIAQYKSTGWEIRRSQDIPDDHIVSLRPIERPSAHTIEVISKDPITYSRV